MPLSFWLVFWFVLGASLGSFLNVCIYRVPLEKSVLWPGSRCGHCLQPLRWFDNLPLVSYWLLRGRCRACGARFSARYFFVELFTGLGLAGLFCVEAAGVRSSAELWRQLTAWRVVDPDVGWLVFGYHAVLFGFLLVASVCDIDHLEIPLSVTVTGTLVGLALGALLWPVLPARAVLAPNIPPGIGFMVAPLLQLKSGIYPWPVWYELPAWLPPASPLTGLVTGLAGMLAGMLALRGVRFIFGVGRGVEGLGMGDADLMMMAGSFLGWQPVLVAFLVAVFPALLFGVAQIVLRGSQMLPFGPSLAAGVVLTWLAWPRLGPAFQSLFFDAALMLALFGLGALILLVASFAIRLVRGSPAAEN
jgi:leader peptidase (prepilin peptidase)/N-methyltransferase